MEQTYVCHQAGRYSCDYGAPLGATLRYVSSLGYGDGGDVWYSRDRAHCSQSGAHCCGDIERGCDVQKSRDARGGVDRFPQVRPASDGAVYAPGCDHYALHGGLGVLVASS